MSEDTRKKAELKIIKRFKVDSLTDLTDEQSTAVCQKFDSFIEGISNELG